MINFFEINFLNDGSDGVGEAICIRFGNDQKSKVHLIDGGYTNTGERVINHIRNVYRQDHIDNVIVTHNDKDHTAGLKSVIESDEIEIGKLWMNLPWNFTSELLPYFQDCTDEEELSLELGDAFENLRILEEAAHIEEIPIQKAFQGREIGPFRVLSPSYRNFIDYVATSGHTQDSSVIAASYNLVESDILEEETFEDLVLGKVLEVKSNWGDEIFAPHGTTAMNEMSIIQFANLCGKNILLTGDAGRNGLADSIKYAETEYNRIPAIDLFQVPHHGSSSNVSSYELDKWLGEKIDERERKNVKFSAIICATKNSKHHPSNAVVRAMIHRGGKVYSTEENSLRYSLNVPRNNSPAKSLKYPKFQKKYI